MLRVDPYKPDIDIDPTPGKWGWVVGESIAVYRGQIFILAVQRGSKSNFASLPPFIRPFYKTWGAWTVPSVIHDYMYRNRQADFTKEYTDKLFRDLMKYYGVKWFTRNLFYLGTRANLIKAWNWNR